MFRTLFAAALCALSTPVAAFQWDQLESFAEGLRPKYALINMYLLASSFSGREGVIRADMFGAAEPIDVLRPDLSLGQGSFVVPAGLPNLDAGATPPLSDIGAGAIAPVPEPGEWAMIVAGIGVVGYAAARRKRAVS